MVIGTTEWILISYFAGVVAGLVLGWLMWKDGTKKLMEGNEPIDARSAIPNTSSGTVSKAN